MGRGPDELRMQAEALPRLVRRTLTISFPILAGIAPGHPWSETRSRCGSRPRSSPLAAIAYLALEGRGIVASIRAGPRRPRSCPCW